MTEFEKQAIYETAFQNFHAMFAEMEPEHRSIWFFVAEEGSLLSFTVGQGQTQQEASAEHAVRLAAMADALAAQPFHESDRAIIEDLRRLSLLHAS